MVDSVHNFYAVFCCRYTCPGYRQGSKQSVDHRGLEEVL